MIIIMGIEYVLAGGKIEINKKVYAKELLISNSPLKRLIGYGIKQQDFKAPNITKNEETVFIDYNGASEIPLDENFMEIFEEMKSKYKGLFKGIISLRIGLYGSYFLVLNFNSDDGKITLRS